VARCVVALTVGGVAIWSTIDLVRSWPLDKDGRGENLFHTLFLLGIAGQWLMAAVRRDRDGVWVFTLFCALAVAARLIF
jgi:hypothetical protein